MARKRQPRGTDFSQAWRRSPLHAIGKLDDLPRQPGHNFRGELHVGADRAMRLGDRVVPLVARDLPAMVRLAESILQRLPGATGVLYYSEAGPRKRMKRPGALRPDRH